MDLIKATLQIYRFAMYRSAALLRNNGWIVLAPLVYGFLLWIAGALLSPFGVIGGLLLVLASDACMSSGLHLIENVVKSGRADFHDAIQGFGVHLLEIIQVSFILWIPLTLASRALGSTPDGAFLLLCIKILLYIFLNAIPELIYQSRASAVELLSASVRFIIENWVEWLIPNLILVAGGYFLLGAFSNSVQPLPFPVGLLLVLLVSGSVLVYLMIFRGILFRELSGSTRRGRVYRYKTGLWD